MLRLLGRPWFWLYIGTSLMATSGWYWHAHQLGQASGLSFGFWGEDSDRSSISLLLDLNGWINLLLRVSLRLLALVGSAVSADRPQGELAQRRRADRHQRLGGRAALHDRHHALEHDSRVLPAAAAAVQLPT